MQLTWMSHFSTVYVVLLLDIAAGAALDCFDKRQVSAYYNCYYEARPLINTPEKCAQACIAYGDDCGACGIWTENKKTCYIHTAPLTVLYARYMTVSQTASHIGQTSRARVRPQIQLKTQG